MSENVIGKHPHGGMFPGREVKTNNIVTREAAVKGAVEAAAGALRAWQESSFG